MSTTNTAFDYIIIGGGSAGCVLANRLSADPANRVCLLETGPSDQTPLISMPFGVVGLMDSKKYNWMFNSQPEPSQNDRVIYCPRGKVLGGSSSVNAMLYTRGTPSDYDHWASLGNEGWGYKDILPYFKSTQHQERGASEYHGNEGELNVAEGRSNHPLGKTLLEACNQAGYASNSDFNGAQQEGVGYYQVTQINGERCSAARAFLHPVSQRHNLTIITEARVARVLTESSVATGIEYQKNGQQNLAFVDGPESLKLDEYSILVTDLEDDLLTLFYHYRDRADCENNFDEIKNQWGWGGFTTKRIKCCQLMARMIALVYNWWNLYVRLALPEKHHEAITSRPLLLSSVGRMTQHGRQKKMVITSTHGDKTKLRVAYKRLTEFFKELKAIAPQLTPIDCWKVILAKATEKILEKMNADRPTKLPAPA